MIEPTIITKVATTLSIIGIQPGIYPDIPMPPRIRAMTTRITPEIKIQCPVSPAFIISHILAFSSLVELEFEDSSQFAVTHSSSLP